MNQNRSCPGVPNRYSTRSSRRVMRPKSMATVVVFLPSTPLMSSTGRPASVRSSSVRSGLISLTAPTRVVLPTPKPPATRILSVTGSTGGLPRSVRPKIIVLFSCLVVVARRWPVASAAGGFDDEDVVRADLGRTASAEVGDGAVGVLHAVGA